MAREKDTRRIVSGVQRYQDGTVKTYVAGQEDALEAVMTAGEYARLKAAGAIEGDWQPTGKPATVMAGSKAHRGLKDRADDPEAQAAAARQLDEAVAKKYAPPDPALIEKFRPKAEPKVEQQSQAAAPATEPAAPPAAISPAAAAPNAGDKKDGPKHQRK